MMEMKIWGQTRWSEDKRLPHEGMISMYGLSGLLPHPGLEAFTPKLSVSGALM